MEIGKGTKVLITGAASGIGRSTAIATATLGASLFLIDKNKEGIEQTASIIASRKLKGEVALIEVVDVSNADKVAALSEKIHTNFGLMDVIMNIAGIALLAQIEDMDHAQWERIINVNLWGPIHILENFVPAMIRNKKKGYIVNVASVAGLMGAPWHVAYSASKAGLIGLSESLFFDLRHHGINVTLVCPGGVDTPIKDSIQILGVDKNSKQVQKMKEWFTKHTISPDKVAWQILKAIRKNKFLIITSNDVKLAYLSKHFIPPLYRYIMFRLAKMLNTFKSTNEGKKEMVSGLDRLLKNSFFKSGFIH